MKLPKIIQGGMGVAVSSWQLARTVSMEGQLGVVSGTGLAQSLTRHLQDGDVDGHMRRALSHFPFQDVAAEIIHNYFIEGGKEPHKPYKSNKMGVLEGDQWSHWINVTSNFVEVFLAKEGHNNPIGINFLEKIQLPHAPSIYGAMLAGVSAIIIGAGIPMEIPNVIDDLSEHKQASYPVYVSGAEKGEEYATTFDPAEIFEGTENLPQLEKPAFFPIVSSASLASLFCRRAKDRVHGFIVEGNLAGGHNAPPRGQVALNAQGEPIYGERDQIDLEKMRQLGLPFWLAGSYGSKEMLDLAIESGATGVQVGTAFALSSESGLMPKLRRAFVQKALNGTANVFTDPLASPTGFPFKVAQMKGTLSEEEVYNNRRRICDIGFLRQPYIKDDGSIGYRCPAEPVKAYVAKGGKEAETVGRKCLCNALAANVGIGQITPDGTPEPCLITLGDDYPYIARFCKDGCVEFSAIDVIHSLLGEA